MSDGLRLVIGALLDTQTCSNPDVVQHGSPEESAEVQHAGSDLPQTAQLRGHSVETEDDDAARSSQTAGVSHDASDETRSVQSMPFATVDA